MEDEWVIHGPLQIKNLQPRGHARGLIETNTAAYHHAAPNLFENIDDAHYHLFRDLGLTLEDAFFEHI